MAQGAGQRIYRVDLQKAEMMTVLYRRNAAFTLIEILIVTLIFAVITSAVVACFAGGLRAWDSVQGFNDMELNVLPGLEILEKDLKNSFDFYDVEFQGDENAMEFACLVPSDQATDGECIAKIRYAYNERDESIVRDAWIYSDDDLYTSDHVVSDVGDMRIEYYYSSGVTGEAGGWDDFRNQGTNFLRGVRIAIDFKGVKKKAEIVRTIMFPVERACVVRRTGVLKR